jgi:hypothetical protein
MFKGLGKVKKGDVAERLTVWSSDQVLRATRSFEISKPLSSHHYHTYLTATHPQYCNISRLNLYRA